MQIREGYYICEPIPENGEMWYCVIDSITHNNSDSIAYCKDGKIYTLWLSSLAYYKGEYTKKEVYYWDHKKRQLLKEVVDIPTLFLEDPEEYEEQIKAEERKQAYQNSIARAVEEIRARWEVGKLYLNIEQFNKTHLGWAVVRYGEEKFTKEGTTYQVIMLHEYTTHCGNTTASFIILPEPLPSQIALQVPAKFMGLLIGRNGVNIKKVQEKYKIKIKLTQI